MRLCGVLIGMMRKMGSHTPAGNFSSKRGNKNFYKARAVSVDADARARACTRGMHALTHTYARARTHARTHAGEGRAAIRQGERARAVCAGSLPRLVRPSD